MDGQPNRRQDDITLGEMVRWMERLATAYEQLAKRMDTLGDSYVPRETHELAMGGVKVDIRRIEEERTADKLRMDAIEDRADTDRRETEKRFRQVVMLVAGAFLTFLGSGVLLVLTELLKR